MCRVQVYLYHFWCGHQILQSTSAPCRNECGCMVQPNHCTSVMAKCLDCEDGWPRLPEKERKKAEADFRRLQAEGEKFRSELNQKNEPEEAHLCSIPSESLNYDHARRLQVLRGNLEKVLKYHLAANDDLEARRDRLDRAILEVPEDIIYMFTNEELLMQAELSDQAYLRTRDSGYIDGKSYALRILEEFVQTFGGITWEQGARITALKTL